MTAPTTGERCADCGFSVGDNRTIEDGYVTHVRKEVCISLLKSANNTLRADLARVTAERDDNAAELRREYQSTARNNALLLQLMPAGRSPTQQECKDLRAATGAGHNQVREALITAACDIPDATELLRYAGTSRYPEVRRRILAKRSTALATAQREAAGLREAASAVLGYVIDGVVACHGDKCRELNCESCYGDEDAAAYVDRARIARNALRKLLTPAPEAGR